MNQQWTEFATALESGDPDRVNAVVDDIKDMDLGERIDLFDVCFDELTEMYAAADDGYVRQSIVRVGERLVPGIATVMAVDNDDRSIGADEADVRDQTDALCGFLLEAITDDDGRVRQSAKRALKDVFRTYDSLDDEETVVAVAHELERMADEYSGKQRKHLLEAKEDAEFALQSPLGRIVDEFHEEFGESLRSEE
ncbi:hypothetical protein BRC91_09745 [Halobacteriales archaeon QS_4_62_28]|nr:MAG: hypothetical protein BRC91_09745 [Halobacteriales archaeon QS_4_62_28]